MSASKPRSDAVLLNLPAHQQDALAAWLMEEGVSYAQAKERLWMDFSVKTSDAAMSSFWQKELVNQGVDTCTLSFTGLRSAAADLLVAGGWATVFGGSLPWFSGRVAPPERGASGGSETSSLLLRGPWHDLGRHVYMAPGAYIVNPPQADADGVIASLPFSPVKGSAISSNLLLAKDQDGALIDGMQVVRRALAYSLKAGAWFQLGTLPDTLPIPAEALRDRTVADVLRACVRWSPSLAVFFDYRTLPPTLHMVPRAALPPVTFAVGDEGTVADVRVTARPDQVIPGVCVQYVRAFSQTPQVQINNTGSTPTVSVAPVQAKPTVDLRGTFVPSHGPGTNVGGSHFVPATSDPGTGAFGTGESFVRGPDGLVSDGTPGSPGTYLGPARIYGYAPDGKPLYFSGYIQAPPPTSADPTPPAPTVPTNSVAQAPAFTFYSIEYEVAGLPFLDTGEIVAKLGALVFTVELNGGELGAAGYSPAGLDAPPYGLAAMIYAGRSAVPYEGTVNLRAQDVGFLNLVGRSINVTGGDAEWATMHAQCQSLSRNTATGETTITLGLPTFLGASEIQAILKAARGFSVVGAGAALTDPTLPPTHAPLPPFTGGNGQGPDDGDGPGGDEDSPPAENDQSGNPSVPDPDPDQVDLTAANGGIPFAYGRHADLSGRRDAARTQVHVVTGPDDYFTTWGPVGTGGGQVKEILNITGEGNADSAGSPGANISNCERFEAVADLTGYSPVDWSNAKLMGTYSYVQTDGTNKQGWFEMDVTGSLGGQSGWLTCKHSAAAAPEFPNAWTDAAHMHPNTYAKYGVAAVDRCRLTRRTPGAPPPVNYPNPPVTDNPPGANVG